MPAFPIVGKNNKWPIGTGGDVVISSDTIWDITSSTTAYDLRSLTVNAGVTLYIRGTSQAICVIGILGDLVLNGSIRILEKISTSFGVSTAYSFALPNNWGTISWTSPGAKTGGGGGRGGASSASWWGAGGTQWQGRAGGGGGGTALNTVKGGDAGLNGNAFGNAYPGVSNECTTCIVGGYGSYSGSPGHYAYGGRGGGIYGPSAWCGLSYDETYSAGGGGAAYSTGSTAKGAGGGGGSGGIAGLNGGFVYIKVLGTISGSGTISSAGTNGQNGGNGGSYCAFGIVAGGGGGGGHGGYIKLIHNNASLPISFSYGGGNGGSPGTGSLGGSYPGVDGSSGSAGSAGTYTTATGGV
jgi:hypothetical protein